MAARFVFGDLMKIILASGNAHKAREIGEMVGCAVLTLKDVGFEGEIVEDGETFEENARIKVMALEKFVRGFSRWKGEVLLADDSGLEVDCLGGAPGVISARYAGLPSSDTANNAKLMEALKGVPGPKRTAQFRCVLAAKLVGGDMEIFEGICRGKIGFRARGANGFGYDPFFFPEGFCRTFAEIGAEEKNRVSHRALAMVKFREWLGQ